MPETPTREIFLHLAPWMQGVFYVVAAISSLILLHGLWKRVTKYRRGRSENRFDGLGGRVLRAAGKILGGVTIRKGDSFAGLAHALILWGFLFLLIGTTLVAIDHDILRHFDMKMLQGNFYLGFSLVLDLFGLLFIVGLVMMMVRRRFFGLPKLDYRRADDQEGKVDRKGYVTDDSIFLWLMLLIAVTGFVIEGLRIAQTMPAFEKWSPVGWALAHLFRPLGADGLWDAHLWSWWIHALLVMVFFAYLPYSKMMHMFTDTANLVFHDERAGRRLPALPPGAPKEDGTAGAPAMGYSRITDFTWKELLDLDACTKCGRCHDACPANAAGTTLSPRDLILDLRTFANDTMGTPEWLKQDFQAGSKWPSNGDPASTDVALEVIRTETLWSCTTCLACVEHCPVGIEHLTSIVQMRRHLVDGAHLDDNLQGALQNLGDYGNSFGESKKKRARWTKGLKFKIRDARKEPVDKLWFVGDFASFDPRLQANSRLFAETLNRAGVDFGILYDAERNAGNDVRRVGEEGLFEMLAEENVAALESAEFQEIITTDPHSLNTLRNEYKELGVTAPIHHYTAVLKRLLESGDLKVTNKLGTRVTYHDPCYLARYNGEHQAPRDVMAAIGLDLVDMPRCRANTFCCGAGGGRIWMDTSNEQKRTSEQRIEEALTLDGVRVFVTACPKDYTMYTDAVKSLGKEGELVVKDLIELVAEAVGEEPADKKPVNQEDRE